MKPRRFATSREAEVAFYGAFEQRDLEAMMTVWADSDNTVCIHPLGPTLVGRSAIEQSWEAIFRTSPRMKFRIDAQRRTEDATVAVHVVHEHIEVPDQHHVVIATNVYHLTKLGWCMVLHHASPAPGAGTQPVRTLH